MEQRRGSFGQSGQGKSQRGPWSCHAKTKDRRAIRRSGKEAHPGPQTSVRAEALNWEVVDEWQGQNELWYDCVRLWCLMESQRRTEASFWRPLEARLSKDAIWFTFFQIFHALAKKTRGSSCISPGWAMVAAQLDVEMDGQIWEILWKLKGCSRIPPDCPSLVLHSFARWILNERALWRDC